MPAPGHVTVDDVDPGAVVELGILQTVSRVQLAVGAGRVVEQLGEGPHDMVVVVEDLVVVPGGPRCRRTNTVWGSLTMIPTGQ
jgi:hypothetical protein